MLQLVYRLCDLDFTQFIDVYRESLVIEGEERYPKRSEFDQLMLAAEDLYDYLRFFFNGGGICAIWLIDEKAVSAMRLEPYRDGFLVAGLETAPEQRGKGFATLLLSAVCQFLKSQKPCIVYSHIKRTNRPSLRAHKKCGFSQELDYAVLLDGSVDRQTCTLRIVL